MKPSHVSSLAILSFLQGNTNLKNLLITLAAPHFLSFIENRWRSFQNWYYPALTSITLVQNTKKDGSPVENYTYKGMCWYCVDRYVDNHKSLVCETDGYKMLANRKQRIPDYYPNSNITIIHNGEKILISFSNSGDKKSIRLYGSDMKSLTDFVEHVNKQYMEYVYNKLEKGKVYTCQIKPTKNYNDLEFEPTEMKINKTWKNVYLNQEILDSLVKDISEFKRNETFYNEMGIPYKRGYLFHGIPGTGKTSAAYAIARENNMNLYKLDLKLLSKRSRNLKELVDKIPENSVVLIEEIDMQIYNDRKSTKNEVDSNNSRISLSEMMEVLDGYDYLHGCIVILTTNHKEVLDEALIRPGRIDMHYEIGPLEQFDIKCVTKKFTSFDIVVPKSSKITASALINQILLPNKSNKVTIQNLINNISVTSVL